MSPILFKIYLEICLKEWIMKCRKMGIQLDEEKFLHNLLFADDQVVVAQDGEDANYTCRKLNEVYKKWGLQINYNKTEYLTNDTDDLYIDGKKIKKVQDFCYLGSILELDGTSNKEIQKRITNGRKVIGMLNSILWNKNIINKTKTIIFKTIFQSIVLYGAETWTVNPHHNRKLIATEMDFWRRAARKSRIERIRNSEIRKIMKAEETILTTIDKKRLNWYGHLQRMPENRIPKAIMNWQPEGRRKKGRPARKWDHCVRDSLQNFQLNPEDAMDRDKWYHATH